MLACELRPAGLRARRDLADLMAVYESNYIRLRQLIPDFGAVDSPRISCVPGALDLHAHVVDRARYTLTLYLSYCFDDGSGFYPAPDLRVRIYQDARVAEVMRCGRRRGGRIALYDRARHAYGLDDKWRMNRFLQKWLGYCIRQGHRFR